MTAQVVDVLKALPTYGLYGGGYALFLKFERGVAQIQAAKTQGLLYAGSAYEPPTTRKVSTGRSPLL
jgi:hypothetical protein|eukprot:7378417-Prymnesium_polylepis.1